MVLVRDCNAGGDGVADAMMLSIRDPWTYDSPFESSDAGNRILRQRMCEIEGVFTERTWYAPHTRLLPLGIRWWRAPQRLDSAFVQDAVHLALLP